MSPKQIALVQSTWAKLAPHADQLAALFYDRLFEIAPDVKSLFTGDMLEQGRKLMTMLNAVVDALPQLDRIVPAIREMGARHTEYGVKPRHYQPVGEALLWTLEQALSDDFTEEIKTAWAETYGTFAAVMQEAAANTAA